MGARKELKWSDTAFPGTANKVAGWNGSGQPAEVDLPTNGASSNELLKSNGSGGFSGTKILSGTDGSMTLGTSSLAGSRSISVESNDANADLQLIPKGSGEVKIGSGGVGIIGPGSPNGTMFIHAAGTGFVQIASNSLFVFSEYNVSNGKQFVFDITTGEFSFKNPSSAESIISGASSDNIGSPAGGAIRIRGGNAVSGSNADGGDVILRGGNPAGTGKRGNIKALDLPTSSAGLSSGSIWNNSGVLNIVP